MYYNFFGPIKEEMAIGFSTGVIVVYMIVFIMTAWTVFTKRDVA